MDAHAQHTPGPYRVRQWNCHAPTTVVAGFDEAQVIVAETTGHGRSIDAGIADAEFIARACNSHYELLARLKQTLPYLRLIAAEEINTAVPVDVVIGHVETAIANARVEA